MTSAAKANRNAEIVDRLEAENERLRAALSETIENAEILQSMCEDFYSRTDSYKKWGMLPSLQATHALVQATKAALHIQNGGKT